jgi:hypothetical protein
MAELPGGTAAFKNLLTMSWRSLIIGAVADSSEFFSCAFLPEAERFSPFRFNFLRARKDRLVSRKGLYATLFGALLNCHQDFDNRLPSPQEWANLHSAVSDPLCASEAV